ncbi:MAG: hypothetical protein PHC34_01870 [Candidatus Gastranaerophilales bacterium]|nr:hypothetical protein [Candidatus Gastranaerophilales bacterium]
MVAEVDLLKTYQQFMQQTDRNTQSNPDKPVSRQDSFEKQSTKSLDNKIYTDINNIKDTFEKFRNNVEQIKVQINTLDNKVLANKDTIKTVFSAFSPIVPVRRVFSVPDKIDDRDYVSMAGTVAVAGILLPEDLRDTRDAAKQIFKGELLKYNYKEFQTPFSFIRGSFLEPLVNKMINKWGYYLHEWDKSLLKTKFGKKIKNLLNVKVIHKEFTGRFVPQIRKDEDTGKYIKQNKKVFAEKLEGSKIGKLICRALQRTTVYGVLTLSAICIPSIVKAFMKPENTKGKFANTGKQTVKSAISVVSTLAGIGLGGALLAPLGPAGSVVGMGLGCTVSAYISSKIHKNIKTK